MVLYFLNFLFVAISILLFAAPFFLWYWLLHRQSLGRIGVNRYLEYFFSSRQANWLIFVWAASESVFWFVIPEFLLLLVVFMRIRNKRQMLLYDIGGTIAGTVLALLIHLPADKLAQLPYIQDKMIDQTKLWYDTSGILGLAHQPFSGIPYKVFTHLAGEHHFFILFFIVVAVTVRMFRYLVAYGLFISLYPKLHKLVAKNYVALSLGAIFIFSALLLKTYNIYR